MTAPEDYVNSNYECNAAQIGEYALQELNRQQPGQVLGVTSAGVFVKTAERGRILFLTERQRHGPLSINLPGPCAPLKNIHQGDLAELGEGSLVLLSARSARLAVRASHLRGWRPNAPDMQAAAPLTEQRERLLHLASGLLAARPGKGFSWLLAELTGAVQPPGQENTPESVVEKVRAIQAALGEKDPQKIADSAPRLLARLLGYGPGLTPSGDDFVLGILLLANRWRIQAWGSGAAFGSGALAALNRAVVAAAYQSTTALSANLIECAAAGHADEYLVMAADYLVTGQGEEAAVLDGLLGWGSNSGIDTLAGMAMVLLS